MSDKPTGDVNSNFTPTTHEPIPTMEGDMWGKMTVSELYDQLLILQKRYYIALDMGKGDMAEQIQRGLYELEQRIRTKQFDAQQRGLYEVR